MSRSKRVVLLLTFVNQFAACVGGDSRCYPKSEADLEALALEQSVGCLVVIEDTAFSSLDAIAGLTEVRAGITVRRNPALTDLDAIQTLEFAQTIAVSENASLTEIDLAFTGDVGTFSVYDNGALSTINIAAHQLEALEINRLPELGSLNLPGISVLDAVILTDLAVLPDLGGLSSLTSVGTIRMQRLSSVSSAEADSFLSQLTQPPTLIDVCDLEDGPPCAATPP